MKIVQMLLFILVISIMIISCSSKGSNYIGKWQNVTKHSDIIEITKNGDNYLVKDRRDQATAILTDAGLEIKAPLVGTIVITYIENKDCILVPGLEGNQEYKRIQ